MKKFLFSVCAVLAILGCGGENIEDLPPLDPGRNYGGDSLPPSYSGDPSYEYGYGYCRYGNSCVYMSVSDCNSYGGNYSNSNCGGNYYPSSSSNRSSSSINSSSSVGGYNSSSSNYDYPSSQSTGQSSSSSFLSSSSFYVSISCPNASVSKGYVFCGGQTYRTVNIGTQTWMAENLNYAGEDPSNPIGRCYSNNSDNCSTYGRLYDWATAMDIDASYNNSYWNGNDFKHQGICPSGWHIPSYEEWNTLSSYVQSTSSCSSCDARLLKAMSGWSSCGPSADYSYSCEDAYGFSALPGGYGYSGGYFLSAGNNGYWWSASEGSSLSAYCRYMYCYYEGALWHDDDKSYLFSVRCLQD